MTREIKVELDPDRLNALGVTAGDVNRALRAANVDMTGGSADFGERDQAIRTLGGAKTLADLEKLEIPLGGGRRVTLSEIATVTDSWEKPKILRPRQQPDRGVVRHLPRQGPERRRRSTGAPRRRSPNCRQRIPTSRSARSTIRSTTPKATTIRRWRRCSRAPRSPCIVVLIFLRDIRATLVSAIALPLSIIPAFWAIDMMGFSLNLVSLLGITLVVGILVDDAIVEIENIVRHIKMGKTPYRAALEAADEIGLAVIAISATIMAVFAPVSFMGGIAGQYFKQFGLTVAVAVFFSLLVARLITPMLAAYFLRGHGHAEPKPGLVMRGYLAAAEDVAALPLADAARRHRLLRRLDLRDRPAAVRLHPERGRQPHHLLARTAARQPAGGHARRRPTRPAKLMHEVPEVENVYVIGGSNPQGTLEPRRATVVADLIHKSQARAHPGRDRGDRCSTSSTQIPDLRAYFVNDRGERQLAFGVMGTDGAVLDKQARQHPERDERRPASSAPSPRTPRSTGPR